MVMRHCAVYFFGLIFSMTGFVVYADDTTDVVLTTDKVVEEINNNIALNKLESYKISYTCPDYPEEGSIIFYYHDHYLDKIEIDRAEGEEGHSFEEYFFAKNDIIFSKEHHSNFVDVTDSQGNHIISYDETEESTTYFQHGAPYNCESTFITVENTPGKDHPRVMHEDHTVRCFLPGDFHGHINTLKNIFKNKDQGKVEFDCLWDLYKY